MKEKKKLTSDVLKDVTTAKENSSDTITMFEIAKLLHEKGFAILMMLVALPLSVPIPVPPGYTTILSLPLLLFSSQVLIGADYPWMPQFIGNRAVKRSSLAYVVEKTLPALIWLEKVTRPRLSFLISKLGDRIYGGMALLCSISIAIPLPLTNFIPAIGIVLMSLGILNKDGLLICGGIAVGAFGLFVTTLVILLGKAVVIEMMHFLSNFA